MTSEHPITRRDADRINLYEHLAWYLDVAARPAHDSTDRLAHLEELARVSVVVWLLDGWQAIEVHKAVRAGATLQEVVLALGEPAEQVVARWRRWSAGQRGLWESWQAEGTAHRLRFDPHEHDQIDATLTTQLATATTPTPGEWR